jgi:hypothetical protein
MSSSHYWGSRCSRHPSLRGDDGVRPGVRPHDREITVSKGLQADPPFGHDGAAIGVRSPDLGATVGLRLCNPEPTPA